MTLKLSDLAPGDTVSALVWTGQHKGADRHSLIYFTVVRVNRKTATVRYADKGHVEYGKEIRVDPYHLNEKVRPEEVEA